MTFKILKSEKQGTHNKEKQLAWNVFLSPLSDIAYMSSMCQLKHQLWENRAASCEFLCALTTPLLSYGNLLEFFLCMNTSACASPSGQDLYNAYLYVSGD